jgi:hypothetical protein
MNIPTYLLIMMNDDTYYISEAHNTETNGQKDKTQTRRGFHKNNTPSRRLHLLHKPHYARIV